MSDLVFKAFTVNYTEIKQTFMWLRVLLKTSKDYLKSTDLDQVTTVLH